MAMVSSGHPRKSESFFLKTMQGSFFSQQENIP
jgi:hypothetical protein